ncbi:MAG: hypothetical protein V2A76_04400 [Planctomycetota bacterium]
MKPLATLFLGLAFLPLPVAAGAEGRITLRVRQEPNGYGVQDVARILSDGAYLGSVDADTVPPGPLASDAAIANGVCVVFARSPGGEFLTLEARAESSERVRAVLNLLVQNLQSIEPTSRTEARERLQATEQDLERARVRSEEAQKNLRAFLKENGAVNPAVWLDHLQNSLLQRAGELESVDLEVAGEQALRDYLAEVIRKEPELVEVPPSLGKKEVEQYKIDLASKEQFLQIMLDGMDEKDSRVRQQRFAIENLAKEIQALTATRTEPNPKRVELENDLYKVERELTLDLSRQQQLARKVEQLRAETTRYALLNSDWKELSRANDQAVQLLTEARMEHEHSLKLASQSLVGEWIQVVAGPQFSAK